MTNTTSTQHAIADVIRNAREKVFKTAKDFWQANEDALAVSYSHYAAVEASKKFPDIHLAVRIARILKIDLKLICHVWAKDQMPDAATRAFFDPQPGSEVRGIPSTMQYDLDNFYIFSERQIPDLLKRPHLWEVLMFIMAFSDSTPPTELEVAQSMKLDLKVIHEAVEWLRNEAIVVSEAGKLKSRKPYFHLPNTEPFKAIRDRNFQNTSGKLIELIQPEQLSAKTAYRTTFMRRITEKQAAEVAEHIDRLIAHIGNLENHGDHLYALTIGFGSRAQFTKKASKK